MPFYTLLWHIGCQSDFDELVSMAFPSGGSWVWLDGKRLNVISSGEMRVLQDGNAPNDVSSGERQVCPDENS